MKTTYFILLLVCPLFLIAQIPYPIRLVENAPLYKKAKVKSIKVYEQIEGEEKKLSITKMIDKKGLVTKTIEVIDEETSTTTKYEYNKKGQLLRTIEENESGAILSADAYVYGNDLIIHEKHDTDEDSYTVNYTYNKQGQIDSSFIGSAEFRRNVWSYDNKGRVQTILGYTIYNFDVPDDWVQVDKDSFAYDNNGLIIKIINCYSSMGCFAYSSSYNNNKQKIGYNKFQTDGETEEEISKTTLEYNAKGLLIQEKVTVAPSVSDFMSNVITTYEYGFY